MKNDFDLKNPLDSINLIRSFEKSFAKFQSVKYALTTNSATSGLFLSALSLGLKPDDKIVTTPISWPQTYSPFCFLGCHFIIVDYMKEYPIIDICELEKSIKKYQDIKAVLIPILYGIADGIKEISDICRKFNVPLIIDASQGLFSLVSNKPLGIYGDIVVFSFSNFKQNGFGEGGAIVTNDSTIIDRMHILTSHPIRIHSDVINLELIIDNLDGFNFNFRIHPLTTIEVLKVINNHKRNNQRLRNKKIKLLLPPHRLSRCLNNEYLLLDQQMNLQIKTYLEKVEKKYLIYPLFTDIYLKNNGKIFFWLNNTFHISLSNKLINVFYWKENLILIKKGNI